MEPPKTLFSEAADGLALAVIASSNEPLLLLDGDLEVIAASESFCEAFDIDSNRTAMIRDHNRLTLTVSVDDSVTTADHSASLGLIVTELVINALKHAFPGHRKGKILVDYRSLGATVRLEPAKPGTLVSIIHA